VGPEHAHLRDTGRVEYLPITDQEALEAFQYLSRMEGIIPALESAHAIAHLRTLARTLDPGAIVVVNLSGRGDKDAEQVREVLRLGSSAAH
jgi:tryptophan synthase beta chain